MGETCGKRIKKLRMQSGMSQEELAGKLNVSMSAVGMYEQSRREPRGNALVAIAKVFGVSTDYLLIGDEAADLSVVHGLGDRMRELRTDNHMTQEELASELGIKQSTVSLYEKEMREPPISLLVQAAEKFHVSMDYLITGKEYIGRKQESDLDKSADELAVLLRQIVKVVCAQVGKEFAENLNQNMGLLKTLKNE